jgi:hypothetical protein
MRPASEARSAAAPVRATSAGLEFGTPVPVIKTPARQTPGYAGTFDAVRDGSRFLVLTGDDQGPAVLTVLVNWRSKLPQ